MGTIKRIEGIIIKVIPYRDYDHILSVFSHEEGLVKLIKKGKGPGFTPIMKAEFIYTESRGELQKCREVSVLDAYRNLRTSLGQIEAACKMVQALNISQLQNKPAPDLYALLVRYLAEISAFPNPPLLASSFQLKILLHEGLVDFGSIHHPLFQELALCRSIQQMTAISFSKNLEDQIELFFKKVINEAYSIQRSIPDSARADPISLG